MSTLNVEHENEPKFKGLPRKMSVHYRRSPGQEKLSGQSACDWMTFTRVETLGTAAVKSMVPATAFLRVMAYRMRKCGNCFRLTSLVSAMLLQRSSPFCSNRVRIPGCGAKES